MSLYRPLARLIKYYLICVGIVVHLIPLGAAFYLIRQYDLTIPQFTEKVLEKAGIEAPWFVKLMSPAPLYADHKLDGRIRKGHPRVLLTQLHDWRGGDISPYIKNREKLYRSGPVRAPGLPCASNWPLAGAVCWIGTGDNKAAQRAISGLISSSISLPKASGDYGNGWATALAYDLLANHPSFSKSDKEAVEHKIEAALSRTLRLLDGDSASLWHGRSSLAAQGWIMAVVLDPTTEKRRRLIARSQAHFLETMKALQLTEGWPEGYNYWINNRAFIIALAASAYVNGLEGAEAAEGVKRILERTGYWHIYATRPDNRVEGLGDEGPRVDLKDETRRVIDLIGQLTRNPVFSTYSLYLQALHGTESYYRGHRWGFLLANDPTVSALFVPEGKTLKGLGKFLPKADLFGRGALNLAYIRSGWDRDATFISFRAGNTLTHHGHYDAGHFSLFKGKPLAINSSTYGGFTSSNRLNYSIRTVAKNSLLILQPGEKIHPNRFFSDNVADGGQRVVLPTGSDIRSVAQWEENLGDGKHFEGGEILDFDYQNGSHTYISSDLTRAYNSPESDTADDGGKVRSVQRRLLYLFGEDILLVQDDVVAIKREFTKKWLLHTVHKPKVDQLRVLKGSKDDGILESRSGEALVQNGEGFLKVQRLYPKNAVTRLVGGPNYQFYVEADGDDSDLDGINAFEGASDKPWFDIGFWRIEIQPKQQRLADRFLVALLPGLNEPRRDNVSSIDIRSRGEVVPVLGAATNRTVAIFFNNSPNKSLSFKVPGRQSRVYLVGMRPGSACGLRTASGRQAMVEEKNGLGWAELEMAAGEDVAMECSNNNK